MLTDKQIEKLKPKEKPYKVTDHSGLLILVNPCGSKLWRFHYRYGGKQKNLALGRWPDVSLQSAREATLAARRKLLDGVDPGYARRVSVAEFSNVALEWLDRQKVTPHCRAEFSRMLVRHILPAIGNRKISEIKARDLDILLVTLAEKKSAYIARICKRICHRVFSHAVRIGFCDTNPVPMLDGLLPPVRYEHHPALLDPNDLGELLRSIDARKRMSSEVRAALKFLALTFVRSSEMLLADWSEINFADCVWTIPAERMKMRREHVVPLSRQAVALLQSLQSGEAGSGFVFVSPRTGRPITPAALTKSMRTTHKGRMVPHGFRASARTILHERLGFAPDVIEAQLAHRVPDRLGAAYNRSQHLEERKRMMQAWADFLDTIRGGDEKAAVS